MSRNWKDGDINWRLMEQLARRGWGRIQAGFENGEGWNNVGGNFRIGRMLAAGDVRLVALYFIEQQPRHGYDLIKAVEERSGGFYSPSPGIVYPALTFLEEAGYVTSQADGNKKLYTITDSGRVHLRDNREAIDSTLGFLAKAGEQMGKFREFARADWPFGKGESSASFGDHPPHRGAGFGPASHSEHDRDLKDVVPELNEARRALKAAIKTARRLSPEQQHEAAAILRRAAAEIGALAEDEVDI